MIDLMAFSNEHGIHEFIGSKGGDIMSFTLSNRSLELGSWMGREPGDITPKFNYTETKIG